MKKSLCVAAATVFLALATTPAMAAQWGFGTLYSAFPLGVFIGMNEKTTLTFGLNFQQPDTDSADNGEQTSDFGLIAGLEYNIWGADNWGFGVFPAVGFSTQSYEDTPAGSIDSGSEVTIALSMGGHFDPVSNVSIYFTHGLSISNVSPPGGGDSSTDIGTFGNTVGELGIAFFLP